MSQVRESAARLVRFAKETGTSVFLVGHVTKEGGIAGPRVLEHMVDAVLYFEGESGSRFRVLRAFKNRFGAVNELGVFAMVGQGPARGAQSLRDLPVRRRRADARQRGHGHARRHAAVAGGSAGAGGSQSRCPNPRRVTLGLEQNRLAMLLAVLHRHGGVGVFDQDVFVNVVGGIRVQETAADLPVLLAVLSSLRDRPLAEKTVAFGEVGLSGRNPAGAERRGAPEGSRHAWLQARHRAQGQCTEEGAHRRHGGHWRRAPVRGLVRKRGLVQRPPRIAANRAAFAASPSPFIAIGTSGAMPSISFVPLPRNRAQLGIITSNGLARNCVRVPPLT